MRTSRAFLSALAVVLVTSFGCGPDVEEPEESVALDETEEVQAPEPLTARAALEGAEGSDVSGTVVFTEENGRVQIAAEVNGVEEAGAHGFHIHETGDCSAPDFSSAGGHFNPANVEHGCPQGPADAGMDDSMDTGSQGDAGGQIHAGDLGNIEIRDDGSGTLTMTTDTISLGTGADSIVGKAVVVHGGADDCTSQPSGDAGPRIACGVIGLGGEMTATDTVEVEAETVDPDEVAGSAEDTGMDDSY